jgi:hypothetical protein
VLILFMALPVARSLQDENIPFAFGTGYGEALTLTGIMSEVPIIAKPYHRPVLAEFLKRFLPAGDTEYATLIEVQA